MRKTALPLIIFSLLFAPVNSLAETKKTKEEVAARKEIVKKNLAKRKAAQEEKEKAAVKPQMLDLKLDDKLLVNTDADQIRENIDLDSKFAPAAKKRGDVSVNPEFRLKEDDDITKNGDYQREKEFKLKFGVGL